MQIHGLQENPEVAMEMQFVPFQRLFEFGQPRRVVALEIFGDGSGILRGQIGEGRSGSGEMRVGGPELAGGVFGPADEMAADGDCFVA